MKIAYLIDYNLNENSGVVQKIIQQSSQWTAKGHTVYFISLKTMAIYDNQQNILYQMRPLSIKLGRFGTALKLLYNSFFAYRLFKEVEVDLIYMRYRLYMPFFNKLLREHKVVMEINSDDTVEYLLHSKMTHIYNKYTRDLTLKYIDRFVAVSEELKQNLISFNKQIEVIANGIDIAKYSVKYPRNKKPTLVFIGSPNQSWHGVDKIEKMAESFQDYQFYIIGIDGADRDNLKYFGYLLESKSTEVINQCDIGIGTLSLYKKRLTEASPLKTRQYLACGLPLIYAYNDTDLMDNVDFSLKLENNEKNIDSEKIESFVEKVFNNDDIKVKASKFAEEKLDYSKKETQRLNFFKRVLNEK